MKKLIALRFLSRLRRNTDGAAAVEFALIIPVFIVMLFGTLEIANILYIKSTLQHGIETAGRYAMVHIDATTSEIQAEALSNSDYLASLTPTFTVEQMTDSGIPYSVISVTAEYSLMTPFFTGTTIDLTSQMSVPQTDPSDFS